METVCESLEVGRETTGQLRLRIELVSYGRGSVEHCPLGDPVGGTQLAGGPRSKHLVADLLCICRPTDSLVTLAHQLIGVANPLVAERMLASLRIHGSVKAWVVHGNGLDELTTTGDSTVLALEDDHVRSFTVDPVELGLAPAIPDELTGGEPAENADAVRRVLAGEHGAHRNIVVLNAGAALVIADRAVDLAQGIELAAEAIDSGAAARALDAMVRVSQEAKAKISAARS